MQRIKSGTVSGSPRQPQQIYYDPSSPFLCNFQFYYCGTSPYFAATERYSLVCGEWCCESESYLLELFSEWDYFTIALSFAAWFNLIRQSGAINHPCTYMYISISTYEFWVASGVKTVLKYVRGAIYDTRQIQYGHSC